MCRVGRVRTRGERQLLRIGEYLVSLACRRLPPDIREQRYREWAAELPAILHDPQAGLAPCRAVRMLAYAADTLRATTATAVGRRVSRQTAPLYLFLILCVVAVALQIDAIVQAPGHGPNYLGLAWSLLLLAWPISQLARRAKRTIALIALSNGLVGMVVSLWKVALAPGDWVNYLLAALFFVFFLLAPWLSGQRARARRA
jgi:hypothetical protein